MAGHFVAEHFDFPAGVLQQDSVSDAVKDATQVPGKLMAVGETWSTYCPLNILAFNVGYHVEHHDLPSVSGFRLPQLRKLAPELYDPLPYHPSWPMVLYYFLTDDRVKIRSRIKRNPVE